MRAQTVLVALGLILAPLGAKPPTSWCGGRRVSTPRRSRHSQRLSPPSSRRRGKQVELVTSYPEVELEAKIVAALEAGQPPDFAFGLELPYYIAQWALDDRLVDLSDAVGAFSDMFDPDALDRAVWRNANSGQKALYGLPIGRSTDHLHVWNSLLEQAGFTLEDIPKEWDAFWSFWCDQVQPAVRQATGRDDIWGVGLPMSAGAADTRIGFFQFMGAYDADYVTRDGQLVIDDPKIRQGLVNAIDNYTAIYRKGCTPPDAVNWGAFDNNERFLAQTVVMTANDTLSIPNAVKRRASGRLLQELGDHRVAT